MALEMKQPSAAKGLLGDIVRKITSAISFALVAGLSGLAMNAFSLGGADIDVKGLGGAVSGALAGKGVAESLVGTSITGSIPLGGSSKGAPEGPLSIPSTIVSTIVMTLHNVTTSLERLEAMVEEVGQTAIAINSLTEHLSFKNSEIDQWLSKADDWNRIDEERANRIELLEAQLEAALGRLNSITEALKPPGG